MKIGFKVALSLAALSLSVACGPPDDPTKENNANGSNDNSTMNNNTANNGGPNNGTTNNSTDTNNGDPNNIDPNIDPNNLQTNNNDNNTNTDPGPCELNDMFFGQIDSETDDHAGGAPTTDALTTDANLAAVLAAGIPEEDMMAMIDVDVSGAIITATNFGDGGNSNFWVEDANAAAQVFLGFDNPVDVTVKVGDAVSFKATALSNFDGHPQISAIEGFTVDSSGNSVPYTDLTGMSPTADLYNKIVRIGGRLAATGESCGGMSTCYDLTHDGQTITYRTSSTFIEGGECVTFFGPLSGFPGPNADSGNAPSWQLNTTNFSWSWTAFEE